MRERLARQLEPYRRIYPDVRWTEPVSWHLTLLFLGSVPTHRLADLQALVDLLADDASPYHVQLDRGDGRVRRADGVAWISLSEGAGRLIALADEAAARCPADVTRGAPPRRTPSAHLTVARRADEDVVRALRSQAHGPLDVRWTIERLALVRSHTERDGARYETVHEATM